MKTTYRIFVKKNPADIDRRPGQIVQDVAHTVDVDAADVYSALRELEKKYPGQRIQSKRLDPLSM